MKLLNLRVNKIGDDGAKHLATVLDKAEKIYLDDCGISAAGARSIAEGMMDLTNPVKTH